MARLVDRLSPLAVERAKQPGMYHDGRGLYLHVGPTGGKSWIFRYQLDGRPRQMGLGPFPDVGVQRAREKLATLRAQKADGIDPLDAKAAQRAAARATAARAITFKLCAERYMKANRAGWGNTKHANQWTNTLTTYAYPIIGDLEVGLVDIGHVTRILEPIWTAKPETASRVRGRIETVLDYAKVHGWRAGENPARWKGHLDKTLPAKAHVRRVRNHPALPWEEIHTFMPELREQDGVAALALEFAILTAARSREVIGARRPEIDRAAKVWTVPVERMKGRKNKRQEHRVPLSDAALAVLDRVERLRREREKDGYVFPGTKSGKPLSNMALEMLLRRMNPRTDHAPARWRDRTSGSPITPHGFRSTFKDWASEATDYADELSEAALAHTISNKTKAAYKRGDQLERRRHLMADWAEFCAGR